MPTQFCTDYLKRQSHFIGGATSMKKTAKTGCQNGNSTGGRFKLYVWWNKKKTTQIWIHNFSNSHAIRWKVEKNFNCFIRMNKESEVDLCAWNDWIPPNDAFFDFLQIVTHFFGILLICQTFRNSEAIRRKSKNDLIKVIADHDSLDRTVRFAMNYPMHAQFFTPHLWICAGLKYVDWYERLLHYLLSDDSVFSLFEAIQG